MDARQRARHKRRSLRRSILIALTVPFCNASCVVPVAGVPSAEPGAALPPVAVSIGISAQPIGLIDGASLADRQRATLCLASAIYYEAATEPDEGQRAVAQVVINRVRHPAWPNSVCGVVYQGSSRPGCQFSFACDGAMARTPSIAIWIRARRVAETALSGETFDAVGDATFYHADYVAPPWRLRLRPMGRWGTHLFYELPGSFRSVAYHGGEPHPGPLPRVAPPAQLLTVAALAKPVATIAAVVATPATPLAPTPISQPTVRPSPKPSPKPSEDARYVPGALPDSEVRPEWRNSGEWIER